MRTLARTDTFMPMKPATPDSTAPIRKPMATGQESRNPRMTKMTTPTSAMVRVLAAEIGLRALGDGAGDLLHARGAGIGGQELGRCDDAVDDRQHAAEDHEPYTVHRVVSPTIIFVRLCPADFCAGHMAESASLCN